MLDKLKSAFFYEAEEEEAVVPAKPATKAFTTPTGPAIPSTVQYGAAPGVEASTANAGTMKEQILSELDKAITGQAYGQYKKMNTSLKARIADNSQRVIATGATLEIQGVKSLDILTAARNATTFLDSEANSFETDAVNDLQNADQSLLQKQEEIANAIATAEQKIKELQEEITNAQKTKLEFESATIKTKGEIEVSRAQFKSAMAQVKAEVEQDIKDVTLHLGGA